MRRVANASEPIVVIPVFVKPIQVQLTPVAILIEVRRITLAVKLADRNVQNIFYATTP